MEKDFYTHHVVLKLTEEQLFSTMMERGLLDWDILEEAIKYGDFVLISLIFASARFAIHIDMQYIENNLINSPETVSE